jgi:hypothetical protein
MFLYFNGLCSVKYDMLVVMASEQNGVWGG